MDNIKNDFYHLERIRDNCQRILNKGSSVSIEIFINDEGIYNTVAILIIDIGEHIMKLDDDIKYTHPEIPWKRITGMRHRIVHDYGYLDLELLYRVMTQDIPLLHDQINKIIASMTSNP